MVDMTNHGSSQSSLPDATLDAIVQAVSGLRFGQVTVIVQDGRVVQIDRTDRYRLPVNVANDKPRRSGFVDFVGWENRGQIFKFHFWIRESGTVLLAMAA